MERFSVAFLLDSPSPSKIIFLKRADWKVFAPNMYTGIGGKIEEGEDPQEGAARELEEETGIVVALAEFARAWVDSETLLYYYWGIYEGELPNCTEGELEWVNVQHMLEKEIIPTTKQVLLEWQQRNMSVTESWTMYLNIVGMTATMAQIEVERVVEGLD